MRIQLLCDQKWRDLPNLAVIKLFLERLGHRVLLSTTKDQHAMIKAFRPECVVFNHLFAPANQMLARALRASGVAVVILPTEGAVRPELTGIGDGEFADDWQMDLFLAWSGPAADGIRARWKLDAATAPVIGCTRFDFYTERFGHTITPREVFCRDHRLDPARPIVTWATAFAYAGVQRDPVRLRQLLAEMEGNGLAACYRRIGMEPARVPEAFEEARAASSEAFFALARARPHVQFIVRPHPADDRAFFERMIDQNGLDNVRFCPRDYIWNVLAASDLHLHRHCTTAVEAWMWDKPTIEMAMENIPEWQWPEREAGSITARDTAELVGAVDAVLAGQRVDEETRRYRRSYIETWFGPQDGCRCAAAAETIDRFLAGRGRRRSALTPIRGLSASPTTSAVAVMRHVLGRRANEPLLRSVPAAKIDPMDKLATRRDTVAYEALVRPCLDLDLRRAR